MMEIPRGSGVVLTTQALLIFIVLDVGFRLFGFPLVPVRAMVRSRIE